LLYFASLARTAEFGAVILIIAALGVAIYVIFYSIGKRWASWEA
jgi:NitT/TauT family transport system permease protein